MAHLSVDDPIAALATPWGESAIGVIRLSGKGSVELLSKMFPGKKPIQEAPGYTLHYGKFLDPATKEPLDEVMTALYREPKSYTGEDGAEIFCHGSLAIINRIMKALLAGGFRSAGPGEFTQRAFLNGKIDLTRAEAVNEIIRAKSDKARALALNRLSGGIEGKINELKKKILELLAAIEIRIDYPEEELEDRENFHQECEAIIAGAGKLSATYKTGKIIQEGVTIVIAGRTNAGKSTLFNLLLREDRAIVSEIHGTTRDYIEGAIAIEGIPIRLYDTAGLRVTDDPIEKEGIKRTDSIITNSHLILYVLDSNTGVTEEDRAFIDKYETTGKVVKIWNKCDTNSQRTPPEFLRFSSQTGEGIGELNALVSRDLIKEGAVENGEPVIDSIRQKELLDACVESMVRFKGALEEDFSLDLLAVDLKEALDCLGEITGEVVTDDLLEVMFSKFCVGK